MSDNKPAGWHSRRHKTSDEHSAARLAYETDHGPAARQRKADERQEARDGRTTIAQVDLITQRPGESRRELMRLTKGKEW